MLSCNSFFTSTLSMPLAAFKYNHNGILLTIVSGMRRMNPDSTIVNPGKEMCQTTDRTINLLLSSSSSYQPR